MRQTAGGTDNGEPKSILAERNAKRRKKVLPSHPRLGNKSKKPTESRPERKTLSPASQTVPGMA